MKTSTSTKLHPAEQYARDAAEGRIVCSHWVRLAAKRHIEDLRSGYKRGLRFDADAAQHAIDFFAFLHHSKGEWGGEEFSLMPWQQFVQWSLFGWLKENGTRRFKIAHIEVGRGNGKTTLLAGDGLYLFSADGEPGAEVYCAATKKDQAKILFSEAERMRAASPALKKRIVSYRNNMHIAGTASKFEPLGSDADTLDGLSVHGAVVDEFHMHKTRELWDKLRTAMGKRRSPLLIAITTAGDDRNTICWEQHEHAEKVLEGIYQDDTFFAFIASLDEGDNWEDERNWVKPNPGLGVMVKVEELREEANHAKQVVSSLNSFLRYRLNVWTNQETAAIKMDDWNACAGYSLQNIDAKILRERIEQELTGRPCYIGVDLSSTEDMTATVNLFPPLEDNDPFIAIPTYWVPKDNIDRKVKEYRAPYDVWAREGFLRATHGDVVDYDEILAQVVADVDRYDVREIAFDPWNATQFSNDLQKAGVQAERLVKFNQTLQNFAEPTKLFLEVLIPTKKIAHLANPILRWNASNLVVWEDRNGSKRPVKKTGRGKIDGVVALLMAYGRAIANPEDAGSAYTADRGVMLV